MAEKRTEEEKVSGTPIKVTLGGAKYEIPILVIRDSREWRKKVIKLITELPSLVNTTMDDPEDFGKALTNILVTKPDEVLNLFFEYAKDLDREKIETTATDDEVSEAFNQLIAVTFPLAESLPKAVERLSQ